MPRRRALDRDGYKALQARVKKCRQCGVKIPATYRTSQRPTHFCSRPCLWAWQRANRKERLCPACGKPRLPWGKTCSRECRLRLSRPRRIKCPTCGTVRWRREKEITARFCDRACMRAYKRAVVVEYQCAFCGGKMQRRAAVNREAKVRFCSRSCASQYYSGERANGYRGGVVRGRGFGWHKLAEEIRERDGRRCRRCGKTEAENGSKLAVDHLIPWRMFSGDPVPACCTGMSATAKDTANMPENLVAVCRFCHGKKVEIERRWFMEGDQTGLASWFRQVGLDHTNPFARSFL